VLVLQDEVARAIVQQIHGKIKPEELARNLSIRPVDPEAQEDYLKGLYYWGQRPLGVQKGIGFFQQALEKDPTYAPAYAGLAVSYATMGSWENGSLPPRETMPKAKAAAEKALELNDTLSQAHAALAYIHLHYDWDWAAAEKEFQRSLQLNNNDPTAHHWYSHFLTVVGRNKESLAESKRALELDPLDPGISIHLAWLYYYAGQYDDVIAKSKEVIEAAPQSFWPHFDLGLAYERKGMFQEAITEFRKSREMSPRSTFVIAALGHTYSTAHQPAEAMRILSDLFEMSKTSYVPAFDVAVVYAGMGDNKGALLWLERAYAERSGWLVYVKYDPRFESLRSDLRFQDIVRRVGPK
jgi:tetratricopeptide (TPR) repeat protein